MLTLTLAACVFLSLYTSNTTHTQGAAEHQLIHRVLQNTNSYTGCCRTPRHWPLRVKNDDILLLLTTFPHADWLLKFFLLRTQQ